ncbi:hypothetical protein [Saccharolobus sp. A20]|uniref:hypothetical protein n=1 Tax=Saccharolobus sp. A20 TaxID=1891280 RepID=UPI0012E9B362|nr:hypothetical protein [Sulfolobus sp. A20]
MRKAIINRGRGRVEYRALIKGLLSINPLDNPMTVVKMSKDIKALNGSNKACFIS